MSAPAAGPSEDLPIDVELIKVLAADSRRDILRLLGERRKTLTELSAQLGLKKATVLEHLKKLTDAGLIRRLDEDDRLWVYYELTHRGRRIVAPNRTRFYLLLAGSAAAVVVLGAVLVAGLSGFGSPASSDASDSGATAPSQGTVDSGVATLPPVTVWRGLDADVRIESGVARATEGTMVVLVGGQEAASFAYADGNGTLDAATLDALPRGVHGLALRTSTGPIALQRALVVREPIGALTPLVVTEGRATNLTLLLGTDAPAEVDARVDGRRVAATRAGESLVIPLAARQPGDVEVQVGRLLSREVRVVPDIGVGLRNDSLVATRMGAALPGARVLVDTVEVGATDGSGGAALPALPAGEHALRLVAPDGAVAEWALLSDGAGATLQAPRVQLDAFDARAGEDALRVRVNVRNDLAVPQLLALSAESGGRALATRLVEVAPGASASALLEAPVASPGALEVVARVAGPQGALLRAQAPTVPSASPDATAQNDVVARVTLRTPAPTAMSPAVSPSYGAAPEPAVPGPSLPLALAAVALAAWALSRTSGPRRR